MNPTPDTTTSAGNGGNSTPSRPPPCWTRPPQQARRKLAPSPPWLLATRAVVVLAALGAIWLTVRGQHPYQGPTGADIPILIAFVVLNFAATVAVRQHAMTGVRGTTRFRPAEIIILALSWAVVAVLMWALHAAGASFALYPTTVLIVPGLAWAAVSARRELARVCHGLALVATGVAGAFAGPAGSWAVAGVGLCAALLGKAAVVAGASAASMA